MTMNRSIDSFLINLSSVTDTNKISHCFLAASKCLICHNAKHQIHHDIDLIFFYFFELLN